MTKVKDAQEHIAQFASQMARNPHTVAQWQELMDDAERRREVSKRVAELRKQRGLKQPQVARRVGVQLRTYQNWEAGGGTSHENYEKLADVLETSYDYLLTGGEYTPPPGDILSRLDALEGAVGETQAEVRAARTELLAEIGKVQRALVVQRTTRGRAGHSGEETGS